MKISLGSCLLWASIAASAFASDQIELKVRLLNAHSGKPLVKREVVLSGTNTAPGNFHAKDVLFESKSKTDRYGIATFHIDNPLPTFFLFYSAQVNGCLNTSSLLVKDIVDHGVVIPNQCRRKKDKFPFEQIRAEKGEVVIFALEPNGP